MNIALFGYGKMGRAIEKIAIERGHNIVLKASKGYPLTNSGILGLSIDVAIEFSAPKAAYKHIKFCLENRIPVISGTTGWLAKMPDIETLTKEVNGAFFYASNFSLGVNLFFKLNQQLAKLLAPYHYKPKIKEIHHIHKKDAPSGTAITLAEDIIDYIPEIDKWVTKENHRLNELPIFSFREGEVPGTHKVSYNGENDVISIEHKAKNRQGFAVGAMVVAEWIIDKKGVLNMDDFLSGFD